MKFPISMTAGLAGYILKNKMRPRPEWQKTAVVETDSSNPFRILHAKSGVQRQPHGLVRKRRAGLVNGDAAQQAAMTATPKRLASTERNIVNALP